MFTGLCAFPLTPFKDEQFDPVAFARIINNLTDAKVDAICAMGSTGLYPYLNNDERRTVAENAVALADGIPVMAGIGALRTRDVLHNADIVQRAGVNAVLLAPMSYHHLHDEEVYALYEKVTANLSVPLCVYENPNATNFTFSDELYQAISRLPNVAAVKIPGMPFGDKVQGEQRLARLRELVPDSLSIGVSADKFGVAGMRAGCDAWHSVLAGLFPKTVQCLIQAVRNGQGESAAMASDRLSPIWQLFVQSKGGLRVMATAADILGVCEGNCLPHPLKPLTGPARQELEAQLTSLQLD